MMSEELLKQVEAFKSQMQIISLKQALLDQFPMPIWIKNSKFEMIFINDAYEKFTGITEDDYYGNHDSDVHPKNEANEYEEDDKKVISTMQPLCTYEHFKGKKYPCIKAPYYFPDGEIGVSGVMFIDEIYAK